MSRPLTPDQCQEIVRRAAAMPVGQAREDIENLLATVETLAFTYAASHNRPADELA